MTVRKVMSAMRRGICSLVSASIVIAPTWAIGGETNMSALGRETQKYGIEIGQEAAKNLPSISKDNQLTIPLQNGQSVDLKVDELESQSSNVKYQYGKDHIEKIKGFDTDKELNDHGTDEKKKLYQNATGENPTVEGYAYSVVKDLANSQKVDMSEDPMFKKTNEIIEDINQIAKDLATCKADTEIIKNNQTVHMPDYKHCNQVLDRSGTCRIHHIYKAGVVRHHSGPYNLESCGDGCTRIWLGKVGDNYINGGSCTLYTDELYFMVTNPDAVTKAELDYAAYDDQMQIWIGEKGKEKKFYQGPLNTFPYEDFTSNRVPGVGCELGTHWIWDPNNTGPGCTERRCQKIQQNLRPIDVTAKLKEAGKDGVIRFLLRDAIGGRGEAYARMTIYYDPKKAVKDEAWSPNTCLESAYGVEDKFATGSVKCVKMPPLDDRGCAWMDGVHVCPEHLNPSPLQGIPNLCEEVEVKSNFNFYKGQMECWTDVKGNRVCPVNNGGNLDTCDKYSKNPKCGFIESKCVEGAQGRSGLCYVADVTYDCGEDVVTEDTTHKTTYKCEGDIACMGGECLDTTTTVSQDFGKVMALMNAAQYMTQDMACSGMDEEGHVNGLEDVKCTVFGGEAGECKIAVGGVSDCCESQGGVGLASYIAMIKGVADMDSALTDLSKAQSVPGWMTDIGGGYVNMKGEVAGVVKDGVSWITKPFGNYIENISGATTKVFDTVKSFVTTLKGKLKDQCTKLLTDIFKKAGVGMGEVAGGAGGGVAANEAQKKAAEKASQELAQSVVNTAGTMFTVISAVYTAYVVATMIIQSVYKCSKEEFEMIAQRDLKNCHKVGSYCRNKKLGLCIEKRETYCCYNSPLSRIMNEQIRKQGDVLGIEFNGFGTAKNPRCEGIPMDKVDKIDWDRVDLSEWLAILKTTNNYPTDQTIDIEKLTGKGSKLDIDGDRLNTIDRTVKRIEEIQLEKINPEGAKHMDVDIGATP